MNSKIKPKPKPKPKQRVSKSQTNAKGNTLMWKYLKQHETPDKNTDGDAPSGIACPSSEPPSLNSDKEHDSRECQDHISETDRATFLSRQHIADKDRRESHDREEAFTEDDLLTVNLLRGDNKSMATHTPVPCVDVEGEDTWRAALKSAEAFKQRRAEELRKAEELRVFREQKRKEVEACHEANRNLLHVLDGIKKATDASRRLEEAEKTYRLVQAFSAPKSMPRYCKRASDRMYSTEEKLITLRLMLSSVVAASQRFNQTINRKSTLSTDVLVNAPKRRKLSLENTDANLSPSVNILPESSKSDFQPSFSTDNCEVVLTESPDIVTVSQRRRRNKRRFTATTTRANASGDSMNTASEARSHTLACHPLRLRTVLETCAFDFHPQVAKAACDILLTVLQRIPTLAVQSKLFTYSTFRTIFSLYGASVSDTKPQSTTTSDSPNTQENVSTASVYRQWSNNLAFIFKVLGSGLSVNSSGFTQDNLVELFAFINICLADKRLISCSLVLREAQQLLRDIVKTISIVGDTNAAAQIMLRAKLADEVFRTFRDDPNNCHSALLHYPTHDDLWDVQRIVCLLHITHRFNMQIEPLILDVTALTRDYNGIVVYRKFIEAIIAAFTKEAARATQRLSSGESLQLANKDTSSIEQNPTEFASMVKHIAMTDGIGGNGRHEAEQIFYSLARFVPFFSMLLSTRSDLNRLVVARANESAEALRGEVKSYADKLYALWGDFEKQLPNMVLNSVLKLRELTVTTGSKLSLNKALHICYQPTLLSKACGESLSSS